MELSKINQLLFDIDYIGDNNPELLFIEKQEIGSEYEDQERYYKIFKIKSENDLFLRIEYYTDSYGEGELIKGVSFVKPTETKVTAYEPVK